MDFPAVALLCLEQRDCSLESHTRDFLELVCLTHYPDSLLCVFYISGLSEQSRARLPGSGPCEDFAELVKWVLVNNMSSFTVCSAEDELTSPAPTPAPPETSLPPPVSEPTEMLHEPTADRGGMPATMDKSGLRTRSDGNIAAEPTPSQGSDQVREPATSIVDEGVLVELEGGEESPTHNSTTVDKTCFISGKYYEDLKDIFDEDLTDFCGEVFSSSPVSPGSPEFPPCLSLPPPQSASFSAPSPLMSFSPSSSPTCHVVPPSVFRPSPTFCTEDPLSPPPASVPPAPSQPRDTSDLPWLLPPSAPPESNGHTASPGSLVYPAPPWSAVDLPAPSTPSGSAFPPALPLSHQLSFCPLVFCLHLGRSLPWLLLGLLDH
ncbi:hypothetical protein DPX16_10234 [Anabarilius grahami]|uniref:Uncharacterized protein n=1 Tax=Anabarilius grahami TaxID=495550 RepID=A0A3N0Y0H7_ANAGA|nr:hypothetical protein DPX16_10234 [Anabarilius grahami]